MEDKKVRLLTSSTLIMSSHITVQIGNGDGKVVYYQNKQICNLLKVATQEYQLGETYLHSKRHMGKHGL